jgi:hypothetical protein
MDTKFWGPSGWKLLHYIAYKYPKNPTNKDKELMSDFLETLPYILPCKFCRASLTEYYEKHPYNNAVLNKSKLTKWLYDIHNEVNAKLRLQHLNPAPDPKFTDVNIFYEEWIQSPPTAIITVFWDFLLSVAYNHPNQSTKTSKPMPNCPQFAFRCTSKKEKNRWNTLSAKDRLYYYRRFWMFLPDVIQGPLQIMLHRAIRMHKPCLVSRRTTIAWLWRLRCEMDSDYKDPYKDVCRYVATYSSDCSKSVRARTCRRKRKDPHK